MGVLQDSSHGDQFNAFSDITGNVTICNDLYFCLTRSVMKCFSYFLFVSVPIKKWFCSSFKIYF